MTALVEGEVQDLALVAYVIMHMLYLSVYVIRSRLSILPRSQQSEISVSQSRLVYPADDDGRSHACVPHRWIAPRFLLHTEFHLRRRRSVDTAEGMLLVMIKFSY